MKALILNNKVVDLQENEFEVHSDMFWVEASTDVIVGATYIDGVFTNPTPYVPTYDVLRAYEYPAIADQLDAFWKGGNALEEMRAKVLAVKEKYPKE